MNVQTVLFLTIRFNVSHLFAHSLNGETVLFEARIGLDQVLPLRVIVDVGAIAMKGYSAFVKAPSIEIHHQIV